MYKQRLETKDLILRKATMQDAIPLWKNYWCHEETAKHMLWPVVKTEQEAISRMERTINFQKDHFAFLVCLKQTDEPIGMAGMMEIEPKVWDDTGVGMGPNFTGKGYGRQIVDAFCDFVFNEMGADKMLLSCFKQNLPSKNLQLDYGFEYIYSTDKVRQHDGFEYVCETQQLTREKYLKLKTPVEHIVILKPKFYDKIMTGQKTIESRWSVNKSVPYKQVKVGDVLYLKKTGQNITACATVKKVKFFELDKDALQNVITKYGKAICLESFDNLDSLKDKKYCSLVWLENVKILDAPRPAKRCYGNGWIVLKNN